MLVTTWEDRELPHPLRLRAFPRKEEPLIDNKKQIERLTGINVIATVKKGDKDLNISTNDLLKIWEEE